MIELLIGEYQSQGRMLPIPIATKTSIWIRIIT
jgi:hypothetical protein